jgi:hypothetical protein
MKNSIAECRHLTVGSQVVLNDLLTKTICTLDDEFEIVSVLAMVTSGIRTAQKQLSLIIDKAKLHGIDKTYPEILVATVDNVDSWRNAWSKLLTVGEMINPPKPAECLFDYMRNGEKRSAGNLIDISNHMKAHSFDIARADLDIIAGIIHTSIELKRCPTIKGYLKESVNNAIHVDLQDIKLEAF